MFCVQYITRNVDSSHDDHAASTVFCPIFTTIDDDVEELMSD